MDGDWLSSQPPGRGEVEGRRSKADGRRGCFDPRVCQLLCLKPPLAGDLSPLVSLKCCGLYRAGTGACRSCSCNVCLNERLVV